MRFELSGSLIRPDPLILVYNADDTFDTLARIDLGFTHFEVICIGAGGGKGGGINTQNSGTLIRSYGGAGGGGGFQRVRGLLSALPSNCPIVVGTAGSSGTDHASNPALTTDGGDGEASTFNTNTCRASGGKGGKRVQTNSDVSSTQAHGGDGGIGNRIIAGGGAAGGVAGIPSSTGPGTPGIAGVDGTIVNIVGKGGGGGAGGVGKWGGVTCNAATSGGRGSYNPGDTSVYGSGESPTNDISSGAANINPGKAGGAKAAPLNGLPIVFGRSGDPGIVIIRLTADVLSTSSPIVVPGGSTPFGVISLPITFTKSVLGAKKTYGASSALPIIFGKVVSGVKVTPKATSTVDISLATHAAPSVRINHTIVIRARTVTGSGAVLKVALYEGATNRSGDLTISALSNVLTDYTLLIPDAAAAAITNYANLSIRIWGQVANGSALVFEVSRVYLRLPAS